MHWIRRQHAAQQGGTHPATANATGTVGGLPMGTAAYRGQVSKPTIRGRKRRKLVLMYAGGGILPERAWPASHYARVVQGLCQAGHAVGLIGLKDDAELAQKDLKPSWQMTPASTSLATPAASANC
jgi:ADP-heptose:LPS heptosyltransferase